MVSLSVDGLISGLDTTTLVSQLVAAEAMPQTRLKNQMSAAQDAADAYRQVNTDVRSPSSGGTSPWPLTIPQSGATREIQPPAGATLAQTVSYINGLKDLG